MGRVRATMSVCSVVTFVLLSVACGAESTNGGTSDSPVRINELQSSNTLVKDPLDKAPDWIELYNPSSKELDLAGYHLTDDPADITKFTFTTDATIAAGGFLMVWASGASNVGNGPLYAGFKLSATSGDQVIFSDADGYVVDSVEFTAPASQDLAYARFPDGTGDWAWCATQTHGALNGSACPQ